MLNQDKKGIPRVETDPQDFIKRRSGEEMCDEPLPAAPPPQKNALKKENAKTLHEAMMACVKIFVTSVSPDYIQPWKRKKQVAATGSGFVVVLGGKKYIVTNAHVVKDYTSLRVRRPGDPQKYESEVVCLGREVDLALLQPSADFWALPIPTLSFVDKLPETGTQTFPIGYPTGADGLSVTKGVVSRICRRQAVPRGGHTINIQIDAAINPGNSGGPVLNERGGVLGVSTSGLRRAQNIGFIIATGVVRLFLEHFETFGEWRGLSHLGITMQKLENVHIRTYCKLPKEQKGGVRVIRVAPLGSCSGLLKKNDVITICSGDQVAFDGSTPLAADRQAERLPFLHSISKRIVGSDVTFKIFREGAYLTVKVPLQNIRTKNLIKSIHSFNAFPRYYMVSGLVFTSVTYPWLQALSKEGPPDASILNKIDQFAENPDDELIVLGKVLSHNSNFGISSSEGMLVTEVNDQKIKNLADLVDKVESSKEEMIHFLFGDSSIAVVARDQVESANKDIQQKHGIPSDRHL